MDQAKVPVSSLVQLKEKLVHFDLKGMPLIPEAYEFIFPFLKSIGATGVLLEYEDMFPFHEEISDIPNTKSYSFSEIKRILQLAKENDLQVIPLIQTFGHFEFVLKLEKYCHLREAPRYSQVICPTNPQTLQLIKKMIDQMMSLHPDIEYLHIGSDEVYFLGMCPQCLDRMKAQGIHKPQLFLEHVSTIATYVKDKHKVKPMIWDDELRKLDEELITNFGLGDLVEIVVWYYQLDVSIRLPQNLWEKYAKIFKSVWIGSAFKGACNPNSMIVNEAHYLTNHYSWMDVVASYNNQINFKGIFLTGWQRYDHLSVLCEIFPAAVPSLVSCMLYLSSDGQPTVDEVFGKASAFLEGGHLVPSRFPGSQIYHDVKSLSVLQNNWKIIKERHDFLGWAQNVNIQLNFSSPALLDPVLLEVSKLKVETTELEQRLLTSLRSMFPDWSVQEWMLTNFYDFANEVAQLGDRLGKLAQITTFPVRPYELMKN